MYVKFLDLKEQYVSIKKEIDQSIQNVISETAFSGGKFVEKFEKKFAAYCHADYAVGVSSGTSALWMALKALGIGEGDEVITVPNTFIATAEAISFCGAKPVFVDVTKDSCTMDPALLEAGITSRTKAVIPVHLYGQMAEMEAIMPIASRYGLKVIEDAAQAHGAERNGISAGGYGDVACFSFYPGKNLGAFGEAGAVVTNDSEIYDNICMIRDHGQKKKYIHVCKGMNERMDGLQGAVLDVKLEYIDDWNDKRRKVADLYNDFFKEKESIKTPVELEGNKHVYHIYQIQVEDRAGIVKKLNTYGVGYGMHYPVPIHKQEVYKGYEGRKKFPVTEAIASETLSLPIYPEISYEKIEYVSNIIMRDL